MAQPTSPAATPAATPAAADLAAADQTMEAAAEAANSPGVHANSPPTAAATGAAGGATPGQTPAMVRFADEHAGASTAKSPARGPSLGAQKNREASEREGIAGSAWLLQGARGEAAKDVGLSEEVGRLQSVAERRVGRPPAAVRIWLKPVRHLPLVPHTVRDPPMAGMPSAKDTKDELTKLRVELRTAEKTITELTATVEGEKGRTAAAVSVAVAELT